MHLADVDGKTAFHAAGRNGGSPGQSEFQGGSKGRMKVGGLKDSTVDSMLWELTCYTPPSYTTPSLISAFKQFVSCILLGILDSAIRSRIISYPPFGYSRRIYSCLGSREESFPAAFWWFL